MEQPTLENIKAAYEAADENGKKMLRALYPDVFNQPQKRAKSNRPVTERVKPLMMLATNLARHIRSFSTSTTLNIT